MQRFGNLKNSILFRLITLLVVHVVKTEVPRPRGVSLARASLYDPSKDFTCFDNSATIVFSQVNDDYCDCGDGSDEPGTSACPNSMFYCTNAGHKALNIFSSRVNDGICDCCDGTDEYLSGKCSNNCKQMGEHAREAALRRAELIKVGRQLRAELSADGMRMKQGKKEKLVELQKQKLEAEHVRLEKEEIKTAAEGKENVALESYRKIEDEIKQKKDEEEAAKTRKEATDTFTMFDSNDDQLLSFHELQTRQPFDSDRNGEVSEEEAKSYLSGKDSVDLEEFITLSWPMVKPIMMREAGIFKPPASVAEGEEEKADPELQDQGDEIETEPAVEEQPEDEDTDQEEEEEEEEEDENVDVGDHQVEDDIASNVTYDEETQLIVDAANAARRAFTEAEQAVSSLQNEINDIESYLRKDFGPDEAFAALVGRCFEYVDHEYIYKLCPFDKAVQQAKSGSMDMRLGSWAKWTGPNDSPYDSMLYDHGQSCWNGPTRSTKVKVTCSSENKLISVSEPNRCEYFFEFNTPAACFDTEMHNEDVHDEL